MGETQQVSDHQTWLGSPRKPGVSTNHQLNAIWSLIHGWKKMDGFRFTPHCFKWSGKQSGAPFSGTSNFTAVCSWVTVFTAEGETSPTKELCALAYGRERLNRWCRIGEVLTRIFRGISCSGSFRSLLHGFIWFQLGFYGLQVAGETIPVEFPWNQFWECTAFTRFQQPKMFSVTTF